MTKLIETKEVLATIAVTQQALSAGNIEYAKRELQSLVDSICDDEEDDNE